MTRWAFYVRHAFNHLRREPQRTLFVLFCIASGVAAVVSLRTVGLMMGDALTRDLQMANRGDIALTVPDTVEPGIDDNLFDVEGDPAGTQTVTLSQAGEERLRHWAQARGFEAMPFWTNGGPFSRLYKSGTADGESIMLLCVDAADYPYYGSVRILDPASGTLAQALSTPDSLAVTDELAAALVLRLGDQVELTGATHPFTISAIVDPASESSLRDPFLAVFPFAYAPYPSCVPGLSPGPNAYYLKAPAGTDLRGAKEDLLARFRGGQPTTTEDVRQGNSQFAGTLAQLTTVAGLVSLLIGAIGIANTMMVVVSRRTLEIAVLKTMGVQAHQITTLFMIEALLIGLGGSLLGLPLGLGLVLLLQSFAARFVGYPLEWAVYPEALVIGLVLGVVVAAVFGFLPTLSAARVRPSRVLRPADTVLPPAGRSASLLALVGLTCVMGLILGLILDSFVAGLSVAFAIMLLLAVALVLLRGVVWLLARLPAFGSISLKLARRGILEQRGRVASTLLALVTGIFCLSLIWLLVQGTLELVSGTAPTFLGGNVLAVAYSLADGERLEREIASLPGVTYQHDEVYVAEVVAINGDPDMGALERQALAAAGPAGAAGDPATAVTRWITAFDMKVRDENTWPYEVIAGTELAGAEADLPSAVADTGILLEPSAWQNAIAWFSLEPGDTLTLRFPQGQTRTATISGVTAPHNGGFLLQGLVDLRATDAIVPPGFVPAGEVPRPSVYVLNVPDERLNETLDLLATLPGVDMASTTEFATYTERFAGRFVPLPLVVSALALFASSVIIANTVALTTLERRRQIGIMKALGMQTERVLGLLLLENGLVGLAGGLLGTGLSALLLWLSGALGDGRIPIAALGLLIVLAVVLSLVATLLSAYRASREPPLHVLRYE